MSLSAILYLAGMALIFVGERLVDHLGAVRWILDAAGAGTVIGSGILRVVRLRSTESEGLEKGHRTALALTAVGGGSILLYVLYAIPADQWLGLGSEAVSRWDA
ncbi:MAG: hypothetical protein ABEL76_01345, partial [Bradymonadaceae bacterium]